MRVAITGGIAEGKSTVLEALRSLGYGVLSADDVARQVFDEATTQHCLSDLTGLPIPIDRTRLRQLIGEQSDLRRQINHAMHPRIREIMAMSAAQFFEIPLLIEGGMAHRYDQVWVVTCGAEEQRRRLTLRVGDIGLAERLISAQLPTSAKIPFADWVVDTRNSPEIVARLVQEKASFLAI